MTLNCLIQKVPKQGYRQEFGGEVSKFSSKCKSMVIFQTMFFYDALAIVNYVAKKTILCTTITVIHILWSIVCAYHVAGGINTEQLSKIDPQLITERVSRQWGNDLDTSQLRQYLVTLQNTVT